jgi:uncharacterized membrane protein YccC
VLAAIVVCGLLGLRSSSRLAGVTITIVMLVQRAGPRWSLALDRVSEVILGIVVSLTVSTLVFPDRARLRLRDGLAQEFLVLGAFFEAILEGFRGTPAENLSTLRNDAQGCAATINCWRRRATSPRAARAGARGWACWRSSAARSTMPCWRSSSQ